MYICTHICLELNIHVHQVICFTYACKASICLILKRNFDERSIYKLNTNKNFGKLIVGFTENTLREMVNFYKLLAIYQNFCNI